MRRARSAHPDHDRRAWRGAGCCGEDIADAFFTLVKARQTCAAGNITEALAIYESISLAPRRSTKR
jgi:hypothetical protein